MTSHLAAWAFAAALTPPPPVPADVRQKVDALFALKHTASEREMHALGVPGLRAYLDRVFPLSGECDAHPVTSAWADALVRDLGDADFAVREAASARLVSLGPAVRVVVTRATTHPDPEVRHRVARILASPPRLVVADGGGFRLREYTESVRDRTRVEIIARRLTAVLSRGVPKEGRGVAFLLLGTVSCSGRDDLMAAFRPLLDHPDAELGPFVVEAVGCGRSLHGVFPQLMLDALDHPRDAVVRASLGRAPNCWDKARAPELRKRLTKLFRERDGDIQQSAAFTLMHDFQDAAAFDYLLAKAARGDLDGVHGVGHSRNWGRPATKPILDALVPHLTSRDFYLRRETVWALGKYAGEDVVRHLIEMLGDKEDGIAQAAVSGLSWQLDPAIAKKHAGVAAETHADPKVRERAKEVLRLIAIYEKR